MTEEEYFNINNNQNFLLDVVETIIKLKINPFIEPVYNTKGEFFFGAIYKHKNKNEFLLLDIAHQEVKIYKFLKKPTLFSKEEGLIISNKQEALSEILRWYYEE